MTRVKACLAGAIAAASSLIASVASATTYDFSFLDNNSVAASGVMTLTGDVVDSFTGDINGFGAITGLIPNPNGSNATTLGDITYDNLFDPLVAGVDDLGVFVRTASGAAFKVFNPNSSGPMNFSDNTAAVYLDGVGVVADGTFRVSIAGVPEPAAWAMMLVGIGLTGATLRSTPKPALAKAKARSGV